MAPIDYSRFDDIDTSSSDDEDGDDTELEAGDAPSVVQLIDSFHQLVGHPDPDCPPWLGQDGVLSRLGLRKLLRTLVLHSIGKATMVISNVPGPQQQRTLCGETLSSMQYFLFSPVGAYIGVCSYAGSVAAGAPT